MDFFLPSGKLASVKTRRGVRERDRVGREREGREKIKKLKKKMERSRIPGIKLGAVLQISKLWGPE